MALSIGFREPKKLNAAVREFTDRLEPVHAFKRRFEKVKLDNSTIITYYGAGGVGKTSLLKELVKKVDDIESTPYEEVFYVQHNFENKLDTRQILHSLKTQLSDFGCEFPLFETGDFCHAIKNGRIDVPAHEERSYLRKFLSENSYLSTILEIWDVLEDPVVNTVPILKVVRRIVEAADKWYAKQRLNYDEIHRRINEELYERINSVDPNAVYDYLPVLFAQDVADWLNSDENKKRYLVVFLDTFEALVNEENSVNIQRSNDLWLRDDGSNGNVGMMFLIPNTLWVIAGRNKLRWTGEAAGELEQHLLVALSEHDSNQFLIKAGVQSQSVRAGIMEVTKGLPLYLDLCVDIYDNYVRVNGKEPTKSDFGEHYQEIVERLIKYMDASTQDMVNFLSALKTWTDDIANEIGAKALPNFSIAGYEQAKNISFIQEDEELEVDGEKKSIFKFDKTTQAIMFKGCSKIIINNTKKSAEGYFNKLLNDKSLKGDEFKFYLKMWVDLIVRLTDNANELEAQYENNIKTLSQSDYIGIKDRENILTSFFDKVKDIAAPYATSYAYFECEESNLRHEQGRYLEAYELAESAYDKYLSAHGETDIKTIKTVRHLINELDSLDRQAEALPLAEKYFAIAKEHLGDKHDETLMLMLTLSNLLILLGRYDEGRALNKEWINLTKEKLADLDENDGSIFNELKMISKAINELQLKFGEDNEDIIDLLEGKAEILEISSMMSKVMSFMEDMKKLDGLGADAESLNQITMASMAGMILDDQDHMQEVLLLRRQILDSCKKVFGDKHLRTITAMYKLADTLINLEQYEEALSLQQEVVELRKAILGEKHLDTIYAMRALSATLSSLDNVTFNDRFDLEKRIVELMLEVLGETHPDTIAAMDRLSNDISLYSTKQEMALSYLEQLMTLQKQTLGPEHPKTIETMNTITNVLNLLGRYEEALEQQQKVVEWRKNNCGENNFSTVGSICYMIAALLGLGRYNEALQLSTSTLDSLDQNVSETGVSSDEIDNDYINSKISILDCLALTLRHLKRYEESLNCYAEEINLYVNNAKDDEDEETFDSGILMLAAFNNFAITLSMALRSAGKLNEALMLNQVIAEIFTDIIDENYTGTIYSMNEMAHVLVNLKRYDEALEIQEKVVEQAQNGAYFGDKHCDTIKFEDELLNMMEGNYDIFTLDESPFENYIIDAMEYLAQNMQGQESAHHFEDIITSLKN